MQISERVSLMGRRNPFKIRLVDNSRRKTPTVRLEGGE